MTTFKGIARAALLSCCLMIVGTTAGAGRRLEGSDQDHHQQLDEPAGAVQRGRTDLCSQMGYNVEYKSSDTQLQYTALAAGDMDFQVEVWEGSQAEVLQQGRCCRRASISAPMRP